MEQSKAVKFSLFLLLQGFAELFMVVVKTFVLLFVIIFPSWFFGGGELENWLDPVLFSVKSWFFLHNVGLFVSQLHLTVFSLGFSFVPLWLAFRSGKRLGATAKSFSVLWAWFGGVIFYVLFSAFLWIFLGETNVDLYVLSVVFVPVFWVLLAMVLGSFWVLFVQLGVGDVDVAVLKVREYFFAVANLGVFVVLWGILRAVLFAVLGVFVFAGAILGFVFVFSWYDVVGVYESLGSGVWGGFVLFFGQLSYLPNLLIWVSGWISGVGFLLGESGVISPVGGVVESLPLVPFFAALPSLGGGGKFFVVLLPVFVGVFVGSFLFRNYFDVLQGFVDKRVINLWLSNFCVVGIFSFFVGFFCGVFMNILAAFSRGMLGFGEFGVFGVQFGFVLGLEVAVGCFLGLCLGVFGYDVAKFVKLR